MDPAGKRDSQEPETLRMQLSARMQEPDVIPNPSGSANASPAPEGCLEVRERVECHEGGSGAGGGGGGGGSKPGDGPVPGGTDWSGTPPGAAGGPGDNDETPAAAVEADGAPVTAAAAASPTAQPAAQPAAALGRPEQFTGGDTGLPLGFRGVWDEPYDEAAARDTLSTLYQHWCRPMTDKT